MTDRSVTATEAARRIWARDDADPARPEVAPAAADRVCAQLRAGLARWVGAEGHRALLNRALELVRQEHPALDGLSCTGGNEPEIAAAVRTHGAPKVAAGIVALVATVIDLLGRVVGEEMAAELVKQAGESPRGPDTETAGGRDG